MRCLHCGTCCHETDMMLSEADIEKLQRLGYKRGDFAWSDKAGYVKLRNRQKHCFFYDSLKQQCKVYSRRPLGCRLYPVIQDEAKGIVADYICPAQDTVTELEKAKKGLKVFRLLKRIDDEAQKTRCYK